ncbi:MAG TPA: hypothetical protein VN577_10045 [Terriglobales bacterium]|nr:hypothetical protein [Terriglobales bacterium]
MSFNPYNQGQYKTTPPTLTDGQISPVMLDTNGNQKVTIVGTPAVTATVSGTVSISNFPSTQAVTGTFWQATQPVSSTQLPAALDGSGFLKVHEQGTANVSIQNASIAVTGTFWQATQPVSLSSLPALVAGSAIVGKFGIDQTTPGTTNKVSIGTDGHVTVDNASIAVTGTFWQATQPVSGTVSLSAGTAVKVTDGTNFMPTGDSSARSIHTTVDNASIAVTGTFWQATQPVSLASLPSLASGNNNIGDVNIVPATSGGFSIYSGSIGATKTQVKASAGQLFGWHIFNSNATTVYVQIYDVANASITVGTTTPTMSIGLPAGSAANVMTDTGTQFSTAINFACTLTRTGSGAPASTVDVNFFYA